MIGSPIGSPAQRAFTGLQATRWAFDFVANKEINNESVGDRASGRSPNRRVSPIHQELWLQFGYAFLFSPVFPLAAVWAFVNNLIEIKTDAFKLCRVMRRPWSENASSIGVWQV